MNIILLASLKLFLFLCFIKRKKEIEEKLRPQIDGRMIDFCIGCTLCVLCINGEEHFMCQVLMVLLNIL